MFHEQNFKRVSQNSKTRSYSVLPRSPSTIKEANYQIIHAYDHFLGTAVTHYAKNW